MGLAINEDDEKRLQVIGQQLIAQFDAVLAARLTQFQVALDDAVQRAAADVGFIVGTAQDRWQKETVTPLLASVSEAKAEVEAVSKGISASVKRVAGVLV